jgi:hypothetical protein
MQTKSWTDIYTVKFGPDCGGRPELVCPQCGYLNLHQGRVTVFDRSEDARMTVVNTVDGGRTSTHLLPNPITNPSSRRHGLAIAFSCEHCGDGLELTIAQHKGSTEFAWRRAKPGKSAISGRPGGAS